MSEVFISQILKKSGTLLSKVLTSSITSSAANLAYSGLLPAVQHAGLIYFAATTLYPRFHSSKMVCRDRYRAYDHLLLETHSSSDSGSSDMQSCHQSKSRQFPERFFWIFSISSNFGAAMFAALRTVSPYLCTAVSRHICSLESPRFDAFRFYRCSEGIFHPSLLHRKPLFHW